MCGILGFNWADIDQAKKLGNLIKSRGPDQDGYFVDENITLGHRRLSIIDLSENGRQPMFNEDKTIIIVFNGEIFNFQEIKEDLLMKGHVFYSLTDTEVIIHAYEEYGVNCLSRFNGQFAFCIYDSKKMQLFLARDRIGINPLFYYFHDGAFIFGSELKIILKSDVIKEINENALDFCIRFGWPHHKECIIKNAYKIEPGHYLIFDVKNSMIKTYKKYWNLEFSNEIKDEKEASSLLLQKLDQSVKMRLLADVPVGAFLSGGVDSSTIVALMSKYTDKLNTFSVKVNAKGFDESRFARLVSNQFHTIHHEIVLNEHDILDLIPKVVYHYDEPFGDSSMIPTYMVSKIAREYVTVSLSGDGGDELFGGYESYAFMRKITLLSNIINPFLLPFNFLLNKLGFLKKVPRRLKIVDRIMGSIKFFSLRRDQQFAILNSNLLEKYIRPNKLENEDYYKPYFKYKSLLSNLTNTDLHNYLPDDILTKVDRASLANSLESRPPFLDHTFIEFACKIDPKLKIKHGEKKYILKKTIESLLPRRVIYRRKMGFSIPLQDYFRTILKELVIEKVLNFKGHRFFEHIDIKSLVNDHLNKKVDNSRFIWSILMFNLWWEKWMIE